jgi:hypothetical protein
MTLSFGLLALIGPAVVPTHLLSSSGCRSIATCKWTDEHNISIAVAGPLAPVLLAARAAQAWPQFSPARGC